MKKLFFILISLPLFFSNCQQNNPSPPASQLPPACCTFNEPNLTYNPVWQIQGVTDITCNDAAVITNSSGDITSVSSISLVSYCPTSTTLDMDWMMVVDLSDMSATTSPLQEGVTYTMTGNLATEDPLIQCIFSDYNCQSQPDIYRNADLASGQMNGTMTFNIDWANNTLSGSFSFVLHNVSTGINKVINNCTFSDLPFIHYQI